MNYDQIRNVEEALSIKLPDNYKELQLNYPWELIGLKFNNEYLTDDPEHLIRINEMFKNGGLPQGYFVIGNDIEGTFFFININESNSSVFYIDNEEASKNENSGEFDWKEHLQVRSNGLKEFQINRTAIVRGI